MAVIECKGCKVQFIFVFLLMEIDIITSYTFIGEWIVSKEGNYNSLDSLSYLST